MLGFVTCCRLVDSDRPPQSSYDVQAGPRVWFVTEMFHPDTRSTSHVLSSLASALADGLDVSVISACPVKSTGARAAPRELWEGVSIVRSRLTTRRYRNLFIRGLTALAIAIALAWKTLTSVKPGDCVLVVTNPPLLPYFVSVASRVRRCKCVLIVHDLYPDVLTVAAGLHPNGAVMRLGCWANSILYRISSRIIVLGQDVQEVITQRNPSVAFKVAVIPNWADNDILESTATSVDRMRESLGWSNNFVLLLSGNVGRTHDVSTLLEAARRLRHSNVRFLFAVDGSKRDWLEDEGADLPNVLVRDPVPRAQLPSLLRSCDVGLVSLEPGMAGASVPSRVYNLLAAERPVLALCDQESELARVVTTSAGWVVSPGDPDRLVSAIIEAQRADHGDLGRHAKQVAQSRYTLLAAVAAYRAALLELGFTPSPARPKEMETA